MTDAILPAALHVGFLTVFAEGNGFLGGYLVTNSWGRPLEFRLSTAVQPNRVQQILYGRTLIDYVCADLIGRTLIEKAATPLHLLVTDAAGVLAIRSHVNVPVVAVLTDGTVCAASPDRPLAAFSHPRSSAALAVYLDHAADEGHIRALLDRVDAALDLAEPFARIRVAMGEARKMGVTSRAA